MAVGEVRSTDDARLTTLSTVLDGLPAHVCAWDADLRLSWANANAGQWIGRGGVDLVGGTLADALGADVADLVRPYFLAALDGRRVRYERVAADSDLNRRSFVVDVVPIVLAGQIVGVSSFGLEISAADDDSAARMLARTPLLDERDRVGDALEVDVLPRLRHVMRVLADLPRRADGAARDVAELQRLIVGIDDAVAGIRDAIRDLLRTEPPSSADLPVVPGPGPVRVARVAWNPPTHRVGVDWTAAHAQALFDSLPPCGAWDDDLRNVALNASAAAGFGYDSPAEVEGLPYRAVVGEAMAQRSEAQLRRALDGEPVERMVAFIDPHGQRRSGRMRYTGFVAATDQKMVSAMVTGFVEEAVEEPLSAAVAVAGLTDDRRRIAEDLHDHVIQLLYASGLSVASVVQRPDSDAAIALANAVQCVADAILAIHTLVGALTRADPKETEETVRRVVRRAAGPLGFEPRVDLVGDPNALPPAVVADLTAVLREALSNTARHARAAAVQVALVSSRGDAWLRVSDNGVGIRPAQRDGSGLANIAARAERHGGTFSVRRNHPRGTVVDWRVPF